jgi:hypothetical protein
MKINAIIVFIVVIVALMVLDVSMQPSLSVLAGVLAVAWVGFAVGRKKPKHTKKKKIVLVNKTVNAEEPESESDSELESFTEGFTPLKKTLDSDIVLTDVGDDEIVRKMQHMGTMSKRAIDARAKLDRNVTMNVFQDELDQHANRQWWDDQNLDQVF